MKTTQLPQNTIREHARGLFMLIYSLKAQHQTWHAGFWPLQTVVFEGQSLQMNNLAFDSSSRLILLTNAQSSTLTVLHVSEGLGRFDSVACFELNVPTISMEILSLQSSGVEADALQVA